MASEGTPRSEIERWIEAVTRLIQLTQSGELEWRIGESYSAGRGEATTPPYIAKYKSHLYRLQGRWVRSSPSTSPAGDLIKLYRSILPTWAGRSSTTRGSSSFEGEVVSLELIDAEGRTLYRVPSVPPIRDLLNAVQRQTADSEGALQELLD
jgi:hypothetical protein